MCGREACKAECCHGRRPACVSAQPGRTVWLHAPVCMHVSVSVVASGAGVGTLQAHVRQVQHAAAVTLAAAAGWQAGHARFSGRVMFCHVPGCRTAAGLRQRSGTHA